MRKSDYTDTDKLKIVNDIEASSDSINTSCLKNKISIGTYYQWKKYLTMKSSSFEEKKEKRVVLDDKLIINENLTLRKLYINLSAHNYELAQFLEKK